MLASPSGKNFFLRVSIFQYSHHSPRCLSLSKGERESAGQGRQPAGGLPSHRLRDNRIRVLSSDPLSFPFDLSTRLRRRQYQGSLGEDAPTGSPSREGIDYSVDDGFCA